MRKYFTPLIYVIFNPSVFSVTGFDPLINVAVLAKGFFALEMARDLQGKFFPIATYREIFTTKV